MAAVNFFAAAAAIAGAAGISLVKHSEQESRRRATNKEREPYVRAKDEAAHNTEKMRSGKGKRRYWYAAQLKDNREAMRQWRATD